MVNKPQSNSGPITSARAARLYRLLKLLKDRPQLRAYLAKVLKIDLRGFYRDLRSLRGLGVRIATVDQHYILTQPFERAVARLPFPDPRLNIHEALELSRGKTPAHRKLARQLRVIVGN
jgi:predicted DNA-binding transcriptional regulator YafY